MTRHLEKDCEAMNAAHERKRFSFYERANCTIDKHPQPVDIRGANACDEEEEEATSRLNIVRGIHMEQQESGTVDLEFLVQGTQEGKKLELRLWLRMLATTRLVSQEIRRRLRAEFGATLPQFDVLAQLYRERGGLRLGELSKRTMVSNGNVTGLVERLEADGLVLRETLDTDRRVTVAKLTGKGATYFGAMATAHEGWLKDMMANVDATTLRVMLTHMNEIKGSVTEHSAGGE